MVRCGIDILRIVELIILIELRFIQSLNWKLYQSIYPMRTNNWINLNSTQGSTYFLLILGNWSIREFVHFIQWENSIVLRPISLIWVISNFIIDFTSIMLKYIMVN